MKKIYVNIAKSFKEASYFDHWYWRRQGVYNRFVATWKAIEDFYKIRGISGYKLRLQRSVENIERR